MTDHPILPEVIHSVISSLSKILLPCFGPNGLKIMLCSSDGKLHVTKSSSTILSSLSLAHPIANLISTCVQGFHSLSGDGCSSFILILQEIFSQLLNCDQKDRAGISLALTKIQDSILHQEIIPAVLNSDIVCTGNEIDENVLRIAFTHLNSLYAKRTAQHLAQILRDFVVRSDVSHLRFVLENFRLLCHEDVGAHTDHSRTFSGICINGDLPVTVVTSDIKFILMEFDPDEPLESQACVKSDDLETFMEWKKTQLRELTAKFKQLKLSLVLSTCRLSDSFRSILLENKISVIQHLDQNEAQLIQSAFNIHALHSFHEINYFEPLKIIGSTSGIERIEISGKIKIFLKTNSNSSLVVCAPTAGQAKQLKYDLQNSIKVLLMWKDQHGLIPANHPVSSSNWGVAISGGGAFEVLVSHLFKQSSVIHIEDVNVSLMLDILHTAFLKPPMTLLHNSHNEMQHISHLKKEAALLKNSVYVDAMQGKVEASNSCTNAIVEPLATKLLLVNHVLLLTKQLLRLTSIVNSTRIHKDSENDNQ